MSTGAKAAVVVTMLLYLIVGSLDDDVEDFHLERRCLAGMEASRLTDFASQSKSAASDVVEELIRFFSAAGVSVTIDWSATVSCVASFA